jgi:hypothetical protein
MVVSVIVKLTDWIQHQQYQLPQVMHLYKHGYRYTYKYDAESRQRLAKHFG